MRKVREQQTVQVAHTEQVVIHLWLLDYPRSLNREVQIEICPSILYSILGTKYRACWCTLCY